MIIHCELSFVFSLICLSFHSHRDYSFSGANAINTYFKSFNLFNICVQFIFVVVGAVLSSLVRYSLKMSLSIVHLFKSSFFQYFRV